MLAPLTLVLVGDILTGRGVSPVLKSPHVALQENKALLAGADLAWGNLEAAPRTPRTGTRPFYNPGDLAILRDAGFDGLNLANNHTLDAGESGARQTLRELSALGIHGAGLSLDGRDDVATWNIKGHHVALLSATRWGPLRVGDAKLQRLESARIIQRVADLSERGEWVVVSLHWGTEGEPRVSPEQGTLAHALIKAGALAVWGHHPHIAEEVESYRGRPIFYSTGNFLWDRMPSPQSGLLARLQIQGDSPKAARVSWFTLAVHPEARRLVFPPTPRGETLVRALPARFDANSERIRWFIWTQTPAHRPVLRALEQDEGGWRVLATGYPREVKRIEVGDLNGDGRDELVVELRQRSKLDPQIKPRLHVYDVSPLSGFRALWRGSMLSRPFTQWTLIARRDSPGCDLAALEQGQDNACWLSLYRWNGFGLRVVAEHSFDGPLTALQGGCDNRGPFVKLDVLKNRGLYPLRATPLSSENNRDLWRIEADGSPASAPPPLSR